MGIPCSSASWRAVLTPLKTPVKSDDTTDVVNNDGINLTSFFLHRVYSFSVNIFQDGTLNFFELVKRNVKVICCGQFNAIY